MQQFFHLSFIRITPSSHRINYVTQTFPALHEMLTPALPPLLQVWDTARGVRCMFEGGLNSLGGRDGSQRVSAALNVAMLDQQVVSFAADTVASASLDIQVWCCVVVMVRKY